jgi:hypothetical protein
MRLWYFLRLLPALLAAAGAMTAQRIDREALVRRHTVQVRSADAWEVRW